MSGTRSTPQRITRRSTRSPPNSSVPSSKPFTSFTSALNPPNSTKLMSQSLLPNSTRSNDSNDKPDHSLYPIPTLPLDKKNPLLIDFKGRVRSVKTQNIPLGNHFITIARVKVPTPINDGGGHLIKRFDTNSISVTSFFKAAFPEHTPEEEAAQMSYISNLFDTATGAGEHLGPHHKLTGTWVPIAHAQTIAEWYGLSKFVAELLTYPDPNLSSTTLPPDSQPSSKPSQSSQLPRSESKPDSAPPLDPSKATPKPAAVTAPRSSKRSRVVPPSFDNTSPSHFSLPTSAASVPASEIPGAGFSPTAEEVDPTEESMMISNGESMMMDPTEESMMISNDEGEVEPGQKKELESKSIESVGSHGSETTAASVIVGTDEQVELAKREALNLVASLQENLGSRPGSQMTHSISSPDRPSSGVQTDQKKRGIDESTESDDRSVDEPVDEVPSVLSTPRSILGRLWSARRPPSDKRVPRSRPSSNPIREIAPLPSSILKPRVTPINKRNLAVAGIVVAGAAASIAPYFF